MKRAAAVLFDFGGTLYDYRCLARAEAESREGLARWAGSQAEPAEVAAAQIDAMRSVFARHLGQPFYYHRDLFRDSMREMIESLGGRADDDQLGRYRELQWLGHERDFELRAGVVETLAALRDLGVHVGMVSNIDDDQLEHLLAVAGIADHFDSILSSEQARSCKPHGAIFAQALERAGCRPEQALFVGDSRPADIAGANGAGLTSVLLWHRTDRTPPEEEPRPHHVISHIPDVLDLL